MAVGAGIGVAFNDRMNASIRYDGSFGEDTRSHRGHASLGLRF